MQQKKGAEKEADGCKWRKNARHKNKTFLIDQQTVGKAVKTVTELLTRRYDSNEVRCRLSTAPVSALQKEKYFLR